MVAAAGGKALRLLPSSLWPKARFREGRLLVVPEFFAVVVEVGLVWLLWVAPVVGFVGSAEAVSAIAAFASDYATVPVIAYMPDLSWWTEQEIDHYLDAFRELLLPQTTVLVGNNATLRHWLLPESTTDRRARATDLARAAAEQGVSFVLVTGLPLVGDRLGNVLASPQAELLSQDFERIDAGFLGAGDILSAALAALGAPGSQLPFPDPFNETKH